MSNKFACLSVCRASEQCAGYFIKNSQCHTLDETNKYDTVTEEGAHFYKKVKQTDFAKEALLQHPPPGLPVEDLLHPYHRGPLFGFPVENV